MSKIIINVKDRTKEAALISFLKEIPFITVLETKNIRQKKTTDFTKLFGIWKKKEISLASIRNRAWRKS